MHIKRVAFATNDGQLSLFFAISSVSISLSDLVNFKAQRHFVSIINGVTKFICCSLTACLHRESKQ